MRTDDKQSLRASWIDFADATKATLASVVDVLASVGERMPGVAQVTLSAGSVAVTVVPAQPQQARCLHCGKP